uniref:hypothetical protein n=1 Tax=Rhodococcus oryzae TaxID=2571143 RepID=UPI001B7FC58E
RRKKEKSQQIPTPNGVEYQNLALTFIGTLLSSQRTRTHHHHQALTSERVILGRSGATVPAYLIEQTRSKPALPH